MEILEVKNISKSYKKEVLKNVSFSIGEGEIVGLVGPNGIGKTTLMKILSMLLCSDSGEVKICGISNKDKKNRIKYMSNFSCIIETPSLYEMLSGYDNINLIKKLNHVSNEKMNETLEFINIGEKINDKVKNYSLGMKQRLALGIALLTSPKLLILDEPTNGLDPEGVMEFRELLLALGRDEKISILISSHILSDLDKICSRVILLKNGQIADYELNKIRLKNQNIILTVENPNLALLTIKEIDFIEDARIIENSKINITLNANNTAEFMKRISEQEIQYTNIEILSENMEYLYKNFYGGK